MSCFSRNEPHIAVEAMVSFLAYIHDHRLLDLKRRRYEIRPSNVNTWEEVVVRVRQWPEFPPCNAEMLAGLARKLCRTYRMERKNMVYKELPNADGDYVGKWQYFEVMHAFMHPKERARLFDESLEEEDTDTEDEEHKELRRPGDVREKKERPVVEATRTTMTVGSPEVVVPESETGKRGHLPESFLTPTHQGSSECAVRPKSPESEPVVEKAVDTGDAAALFGATVAALLRPLSGKRLVKCQSELLAVVEKYIVE